MRDMASYCNCSKVRAPMLNMAIVGLGRWGQRLVDAVHEPANAKLRFTHAVARTPEKLRAYCDARGMTVHGDLGRTI